MLAIELINIICPEHTRTSCSDENLNNGFSFEDDYETISLLYHPRCSRCALLEIANSSIELSKTNEERIKHFFNHI